MKEQLLKIHGNRKLAGGQVKISGSANQVTKCIIASLLTDKKIIIKDAPEINERFVVEELFKALGGEIRNLDSQTLELSGSHVGNYEIPKEFSLKNRISILAIGPLLHRFGRASICKTLGGDQIGKRPVDFHIQGFQKMGVDVRMTEERYEFRVKDSLQGAHIVLPFPSVMTTENLIIAASLAKGRTIIENAAVEPEIIELVKMLQKMGADIMMNPHRTFIIQGVCKLKGCEIRLMPDRNQAVSFACAALATGGNVLLEKMPHDPLYSFLNFIQRMGAEFKVNSEGVYVSSPNNNGRLRGTHVEVEVHPGFMTDWQQPFMVLFTQAEGVSILHETIFEGRLKYASYLQDMGANITLFSTCLGESPCRFKNKNHLHSAIIQGPRALSAKNMRIPTDIRAGICQVIAGLVAHGTTILANVEELRRKYDHLVEKLQDMGADISLYEGDFESSVP